MLVEFKNERTGQKRQAPEGFSFTTLLFGALVPLCRGDFKWFLIMCIGNLIGFSTVILAPIFWLVFAAMYNSEFIKGLENEGFSRVGGEPQPVEPTSEPNGSIDPKDFDAEIHTVNAMGRVVLK